MKYSLESKILQMQASIVSLKIEAALLEKEAWMKGEQRRGENGKFAKTVGVVSDSWFGDRTFEVGQALSAYGIDFDDLTSALQRRRGNINPDKLKQQIEQINLQIEKNQQEVTEIEKFLSQDTVKDKISIDIVEKLLRLASLESVNQSLLKELDKKQESYVPLVQKRVEELSDIFNQEGDRSLRGQWRANVIKSEIKYGAIVDRLGQAGGDGSSVDVFGINRAAALKIYNQLIQAISKENPSIGSFHSISSRDLDKLKRSFKQLKQPEPITLEEDKKRIIDMAIDEAKVFQKLARSSLDIEFGIYSSRPHSMAGKKWLINTPSGRIQKKWDIDFYKKGTSDGMINMGDTAYRMNGRNIYGYNPLASPEEHIKEITFHEMGHILEARNKAIDLSVAFRTDRGNETSQEQKSRVQFNPLVTPEESLIKDKFFNPYVGLKYTDATVKKDVATEIVSSGCEALGSPILASRYAAADRESLLYAISVIDMEPPKEAN